MNQVGKVLLHSNLVMNRNHPNIIRQPAPKTFGAAGLLILAAMVAGGTLPVADAHARTVTTRARSQQELNRELESKNKLLSERREKLRKIKEQERKAFAKLHSIESHLHQTTKKLNSNKNELHKTEKTLVHVETNLKTTNTQEQNMEEQASHRLREMYEGQRLGLLDMLFQVNSLQQLMDLLYYQERVAELDKALISGLRARAVALSQQKSRLGQQKMQLGDIVSEIAKKALMLNKEKSEQEEVAERLRSQRAFYEAAERQLSRESNQLQNQILQMVRASESNNTNRVVTRGSGTMAMPLRAPVTSPFGYRRHPIFGGKRFHSGVDLAGPNHSPIKAADSGNVIYSGHYGGYGKVVIINHGNGMATLYAHQSKIAVSEGDNVSKGQVVGYEGSTGFSTGPHLHFEVRVDGKPNNPLNFVR